MLDTLLTHPLTLRVGWTLVHALWQGAALAAVLGLGLGWLATERHHQRHALATTVLLLWLVAPALTFLALAPDRSAGASVLTQPATVLDTVPRAIEPLPAAASPAVDLARVAAATVQGSTAATAWRQSVPFIALAWVVVATWRSLLLLGGLLTANHVRRSGAPLPQLEVRLRALAARLGLRRRVRLRCTIRVDAPSVVGWWKPVILLPASTLTGLSPQQLELILAHELAHVRRHDYLVNVLQGVAEALLFFHPLTWWLSRTLRFEREHACDDLALQATGAAPLALAEALTRLEGARSAPAPALAATGHLTDRVRRLLRAPAPKRAPSVLPLLALVPLSVWLAVAAAPTATADGFFERQAGSSGVGPYFEGGGTVLAFDELVAQASVPIHAATLLPDGYRFDNATWNASTQTAFLTYGAGVGGLDGSRFAHHLTLLQAPADAYRPVPIAHEARIEPVAVGTRAGAYVTGTWTRERGSTSSEPRYQWKPTVGRMLAWERDGTVFVLYTDAPPVPSGAGVGRDDLLTVALALVAAEATWVAPTATVRLPNATTRAWATLRGDLTFAPDLASLASIGQGGSLILEERSPERARRVIVTPASNGDLNFEYLADGAPAPFDAQARTWYESLMAELVLRPIRDLRIDPKTANYTVFNQSPDRYVSTIGLPGHRRYRVDLGARTPDPATRWLVAKVEQLAQAAAHGLVDQGRLEVALHDYLAQAQPTAEEIASFAYAIDHLDDEPARRRLHELLRGRAGGVGS